jgi:hypothetical protein
MVNYPKSMAITASVLEGWREAERGDWEAKGRPHSHPHAILKRHARVVRMESETEAMLLFDSALRHARWWEADTHPYTAIALRDLAGQLVDELWLWRQAGVIERWLRHVRDLTDVYQRRALAWGELAAIVARRHSSVARFVEKHGITLEAKPCDDAIGAEFLPDDDESDLTVWDVTLTLSRRASTKEFTPDEPDAAAVLEPRIHAAQRVALVPDFETWYVNFGTEYDEPTARRLYQAARLWQDWLRSFLGEELYREAITEVDAWI